MANEMVPAKSFLGQNFGIDSKDLDKVLATALAKKADYADLYFEYRKNEGVGLETSFANGGQLSYSYVAPLASPSVIPKIPPWLLRRDSPLRFRPAIDPDQWRWCLEFLAACNQRTADETTRRLLRLAFYSRDLMHELVRDQAVLKPYHCAIYH